MLKRKGSRISPPKSVFQGAPSQRLPEELNCLESHWGRIPNSDSGITSSVLKIGSVMQTGVNTEKSCMQEEWISALRFPVWIIYDWYIGFSCIQYLTAPCFVIWGRKRRVKTDHFASWPACTETGILRSPPDHAGSVVMRNTGRFGLTGCCAWRSEGVILI